MGKLDKERVGGAPQSIVTPKLLAHMYDTKAGPTVDSFGRLNPTQDQLDQLARTLGRIREGKQPLASPQIQPSKPSQRDLKPRYNNRPPHGRGR